jgi:hypothetical protein
MAERIAEHIAATFAFAIGLLHQFLKRSSGNCKSLPKEGLRKMVEVHH